MDYYKNKWMSDAREDKCSVQAYTFPPLEGKTIVSSEWLDDNGTMLSFVLDDGSVWRMYHDNDCCETVEPSFKSPLAPLHGKVLGEVKVEVFRFEGDEDGSRTDTLYSFTVTREYDAAVRVHWVGTSNGYYSETVDLAQLTPPTVAVPA